MAADTAQASDSARSPGITLPRVLTGFDVGGILATGVLPFALVTYLGLKGGGYDQIVSGEVGIAAWWIVLIGAVAGLLPLDRPSKPALITAGAALTFALWTALALTWTDSAERTSIEIARVLSLVGVYVVAIALQGPSGLRRTLSGVAAAIALLGIFAVGSRIHPSWFPENVTSEFVPETESRLNYPLNYWNGLAALMAIGLPLLLAVASTARTVLVRALAGAAIPAVALAAFLTLSRGGFAEIAIGIGVFIALAGSRLAVAPTLLITAAGSGLLIAAAAQRDDLLDGLDTATAATQGDEMLAFLLVAMIGTGLLIAALTLGDRAGLLPTPPKPDPIFARRATAGAVVLAALVFLFAGGPGKLSDGFDEFRSTGGEAGSSVDRLSSVDGSFRWQMWESALDANATDPLVGIGPGTFEYWWAANGTENIFVRDAHSLYVETLAEAGIIGLILLAGFLGMAFVAPFRAWRASVSTERILLAGAIGAMVAFVVAAAIDWVWELTVIPIAFLLISSAALGSRKQAGDRRRPLELGIPARAGVALVALGATAAIALPVSSVQELRASQAAANDADIPGALDRAERATDLQPFAGSPWLQQALVFELDGRLGRARAAAVRATEEEKTNWRTWFVLARVEAELGNADASLEAFREAKRLNPRSVIFGE